GRARRVAGPRGARAAHLPTGRRHRAASARGRATDLHPSSRRPTLISLSTQLEIRSLTYADLPQVIAIERRSFPTPWSLAMFVLELSKPSGVCLAAVENGVVVGYLVCSKYDRVWHLMNIAVDPALRNRGLGRRLLEALFDRAGQDASYTLEVRTSNAPAI